MNFDSTLFSNKTFPKVCAPKIPIKIYQGLLKEEGRKFDGLLNIGKLKYKKNLPFCW